MSCPDPWWLLGGRARAGRAPQRRARWRVRRGAARRRCLDLWLSDVKAYDGTRPATLVLYQGLADHYVKPVIGPVRLDRLTPRHVQRLIVETRDAEVSRGRPPTAATQRQIHTLIRNALGDAYRLELVTRNVAAQVKAPPMARQRRPDLTVDQARHLLEVI